MREPGLAERPVGQQAAIFPGEGNALSDALIDDVDADLGQAINVRFATAKIAPLDGVIIEPFDAVAVVGVVLGGVDATLGRDAVGPSW